MNLVFCTHSHAAATSNTTGPAGGLSTGDIFAIVVCIVATIPTIITIIAGVYRFKQWWKKRGNGSKLFIRKPRSQISLFCCCW